MFEKIKQLFTRKNKKEEIGLDKSKHRQHTTRYEDLCQ